MNDLKVFNHSEFGELGVLIIDEKEYFPASACARILGYSNPRDAIKRHCKSEGVVKHDAWVQTGIKADGSPAMRKNSTNYITEGNLYRLIVGSKLPEAEKFERWVFDEVLVSIRRQGAYIPNLTEIIAQTVQATVSEVMKQMLPLFSELAKEKPQPAAPPRPVYTPEEVAFTPQRLKLETFPEEIREMVDEKLAEMADSQNINFSHIARMCTLNGYVISSPSVKTYFKRHFCRD